jgi:hypothetical protein
MSEIGYPRKRAHQRIFFRDLISERWMIGQSVRCCQRGVVSEREAGVKERMSGKERYCQRGKKREVVCEGEIERHGEREREIDEDAVIDKER